jgi:hypothetical protein
MTGRIAFASGRTAPVTGRIAFASGRTAPVTGRIAFASGRTAPVTGAIVFASKWIAFTVAPARAIDFPFRGQGCGFGKTSHRCTTIFLTTCSFSSAILTK